MSPLALALVLIQPSAFASPASGRNDILCPTGARGYLLISNRGGAELEGENSAILNERGNFRALDLSQLFRILPGAIASGLDLRAAFFHGEKSGDSYAMPRKLKRVSEFNTIRTLGSEPPEGIRDSRPELQIAWDNGPNGPFRIEVSAAGQIYSIDSCTSISPNTDPLVLRDLTDHPDVPWQCALPSFKNNSTLSQALRCEQKPGPIEAAYCYVKFWADANYSIGDLGDFKGKEIQACAKELDRISNSVTVPVCNR